MEQADFKIARDGTWYHNGAAIKREALAKLFSDRALSVDAQGRYWLKTPFEQYPVAVEDVPFVVVDYEAHEDGINFRTNMDEIVELGPDHGLELRAGVPYIEVRNGLYARIARAVYYNLVREYGAVVHSRGMDHRLGQGDGEA